MFCTPAFRLAGIILRVSVIFIVIIQIRTAEQSCTFLNMKFDVAFKINTAGEINSGRDNNGSALNSTFVNCTLNSGGIFGNTVADSTITTAGRFPKMRC